MRNVNFRCIIKISFVLSQIQNIMKYATQLLPNYSVAKSITVYATMVTKKVFIFYLPFASFVVI